MLDFSLLQRVMSVRDNDDHGASSPPPCDWYIAAVSHLFPYPMMTTYLRWDSPRILWTMAIDGSVGL